MPDKAALGGLWAARHVVSSRVAASTSKCPLRHPKYNLIETMRPLIKVYLFIHLLFVLLFLIVKFFFFGGGELL